MRDVRVAYSLEQCWHRVPGGTAVSALEVARHLRTCDDVEIVPFAGRHKGPPGIPLDLGLPIATLPFGRPLLYETWLRLAWPKVESVCSDVDLVHGTTIIPPATTLPLTITIHDLAFLRYPEFFTKRGNRIFRRSLDLLKQRRCIVMCSSSATMQDCITAGLDPSLLRLVPLGVQIESPTEADLTRVRATYELPDKFVLFVGTMEPRKNLPRLIEAMNRMPERLPLVIAGVEGWADTPVVPHDMPVSFLGKIHQHNLAALYKAATVLAYPSVWEGFGLPILEAMAQGTAVVTSQGTSTEEVAGGAAVLVDPLDVSSIATGIREAMNRVDELGVAGRERAQQMTWQHTADMTSDVYREVVERAHHKNVGRS